jgi:hypothetical protein
LKNTFVGNQKATNENKKITKGNASMAIYFEPIKDDQRIEIGQLYKRTVKKIILN